MKDVSALPVSNFRKSNLTIRVISAIVLMPIVIVSTYLGYPYFNLLVGICAGLIAWEYNWIVSSGRLDYGGKGLIISLIGAVLVASLKNFIMASFFLVATSFIFLGFGAAKIIKSTKTLKGLPKMEKVSYPINSLWLVAGMIYMGGACITLIWIRNEWDNGLLTAIWLLVLVWASDTGAYAAGRIIGGAKLAPNISPKKTWAGLVGCVLSACIVGAVIADISNIENFYRLVVISGFVGLVSQMGDLIESSIKRHFGVKDSSNLIPGHGGVLDRVDALLAAIFAAAFLYMFNQAPLLS